MPFMQRVLSSLNEVFSEKGIRVLREHRASFSEGSDLPGAFTAFGRELSDHEIAYLARAPRGMKEAIRALIHENLGRASPCQSRGPGARPTIGS